MRKIDEIIQDCQYNINVFLQRIQKMNVESELCKLHVQSLQEALDEIRKIRFIENKRLEEAEEIITRENVSKEELEQRERERLTKQPYPPETLSDEPISEEERLKKVEERKHFPNDAMGDYSKNEDKE